MNTKDLLSGVGPEAPTTVNELGGQQSDTRWRFDLMPPEAMIVLARILDMGSHKYPEWNHRLISTHGHLNKVLIHIYAYLAGDRSDDHLGHAFCRMMFALDTAMRSDGYVPIQADELVITKDNP